MKTVSAAPEGAEAPASVQETAKAKEPQGPVKLSPEKWRGTLYPNGSRGQPQADAWKHSAAAALHRWDDYEHHNGKALLLEQKDYESALKAAEGPVELPRAKGEKDDAPKRFDYVPHPAANGAPKPEEGK